MLFVSRARDTRGNGRRATLDRNPVTSVVANFPGTARGGGYEDALCRRRWVFVSTSLRAVPFTHALPSLVPCRRSRTIVTGQVSPPPPARRASSCESSSDRSAPDRPFTPPYDHRRCGARVVSYTPPTPPPLAPQLIAPCVVNRTYNNTCVRAPCVPTAAVNRSKSKKRT